MKQSPVFAFFYGYFLKIFFFFFHLNFVVFCRKVYFNWTSTKIGSCRWTKSWFQPPTTQQLNFYSFSFCNFSICKYDCFVFDLPFEINFKTKFNSIIISNSSNYIMRLRMSVECFFCYYKPLVLQTNYLWQISFEEIITFLKQVRVFEQGRDLKSTSKTKFISFIGTRVYTSMVTSVNSIRMNLEWKAH